MQLVVNHQLISILIQHKSICLEQSLFRKASDHCHDFTVLSPFFHIKKKKTKQNKKNKQTNKHGKIKIYLDIKVFFSLVT